VAAPPKRKRRTKAEIEAAKIEKEILAAEKKVAKATGSASSKKVKN